MRKAKWTKVDGKKIVCRLRSWKNTFSMGLAMEFMDMAVVSKIETTAFLKIVVYAVRVWILWVALKSHQLV